MPLPGFGKDPLSDMPLQKVTDSVTENVTSLADTAVNMSSMAEAAATHGGVAVTRAPGVDDWTSRPNPLHPNPVVLVHGTFGNAYDYWLTAAPMLAASGYCVFRVDYGQLPGVQVLHGIDSIPKAAEQLSDFVDKVLQATGASKVDIVGHSQGGMMPRYYLKFLDGAKKVDQLIALAPSNHGTDADGLQKLAKQFPGGEELINSTISPVPAMTDQLSGSEVLTKLNADGETIPGVRYTVIASKYDEVVTPYSSQFLKEDGADVRNILLQDLYPADLSEHMTIHHDPMALREVLKQLDAGSAGSAVKSGKKSGVASA